MGWERKRGKLDELNRLLRGANDTTFLGIDRQPHDWLEAVRYVITLDTDTRLAPGVAYRLVGTMAHPLNHPEFSPRAARVVEGYAIMQPRVMPTLPTTHEGSIYQKLFSGPSGIDAYVSAVSDVYQDLFREGSFTGKGIYDVDAFRAALAGKVPDNCVLSHVFEGIFARTALATDIEFFEEFPSTRSRRRPPAALGSRRLAASPLDLRPRPQCRLTKGDRPRRRPLEDDRQSPP